MKVKRITSLKVILILLSINLITNKVSAESDTCFVVQIRKSIIAGNDDVEEWTDGAMYLNSSDIELVNDGNRGDQIVGLRFTDLPLEQGVEIVEAYLHFTANEDIGTNVTNLSIHVESSANSLPFSEDNYNLSNRSINNDSVEWQPPAWNQAGEKDEPQKTPDLKMLIQETVNLPDWQPGNALTFVITGSGRRTSHSFEANPNQSAELVIKLSYPKPDTVIQDVYLNELMAANTLIPDEYGETDDWLEIYNQNTEPLVLGGLYITDDRNDLQKWQITNSSIIAPNGFGLIWADGTPEQGGSHANFKLKSSGEFLALVQELDGNLYILDSLTFPQIPQNVSYGRIADGANEWVFFGSPSPNTSNDGQAQYLDESITFSHLGGHYPSELLLEMTVSDPSVEIYYTLDGNSPTKQSQLYQAPIPIDQTMMVQARAFKGGFINEEITTEFFMIGENSALPILNIRSDPNNLWDDETGIYVKGTNGTLSYCDNITNNWNQNWEKPCQLTFFEPDGTQGFQVNAGMKIGGACSRNLKMKSFNFFLRNNEYGDEKIDYQIFPHSEISEFRRIKVRNGGTDWIEMLFRDGMNSLLLANTVDLDLMAYRPVKVYINGQFWGLYGLREMFNKHYIESHHGVNKDSVDLLGDPYGPRSEVREGDDLRYQEMMSFLKTHSLDFEANYQTIQEYIDLQQYLNYHISQIYLANYDWPGNNVRIWRDHNGGKFRWMLFDTDASSGFQGWSANVCNPEHNTLAHMMNTQNVRGVPGFSQWPNGPESTFLFRKMIQNEDFKNEFVQRTCTFRELIFSTARVFPMVDSIKQLLAPEMNQHINQWKGKDHLGQGIPVRGFVSQWNNSISAYRKFFADRGFHLLNAYQQTLNLGGRYQLTINYDNDTPGKVVIHENEMNIPFNYEGEYFQNIPIRLKAIPNDGFFFSHWEETGDTEAEIQFMSSEDATLTPIFVDQEKDTVDTAVISPPNLELKIYPNPVEDFLYIILPDKEDQAKLTLIDQLGKAVLRKTLLPAENKIDLQQFSAGLYFVKIEMESGNVVEKIILN